MTSQYLPIGFVKAIRKENEIGPDGIVYEDNFVIIERKNNQLIETGKPIRMPFIYAEG